MSIRETNTHAVRWILDERLREAEADAFAFLLHEGFSEVGSFIQNYAKPRGSEHADLFIEAMANVRALMGHLEDHLTESGEVVKLESPVLACPVCKMCATSTDVDESSIRSSDESVGLASLVDEVRDLQQRLVDLSDQVSELLTSDRRIGFLGSQGSVDFLDVATDQVGDTLHLANGIRHGSPLSSVAVNSEGTSVAESQGSATPFVPTAEVRDAAPNDLLAVQA